MQIDRHSGDHVRTIIANSSVGVVMPRRHSKWSTDDDVRQWRELPIIDEQSSKAVGDSEVAVGNKDDVFDIPEIGTARTIVESWVARILHIGYREIALRVRHVEALRPRVVSQQTEAR